jgi:Zn-dependent M28 family amino/carboxypeptidase
MSEKNKDKAPHIYITSSLAKDIIDNKSNEIIKSRNEIMSKGKLNPVTLKKSIKIKLKQNINILKSQNIIGYVKGASQTDQYVIVSAHYDHIGQRGDDVFYGADDNGSGTSTILELAQAFSKAAKEGYAPSRNIVFLLVTGEEKGLLGSEYYVNNPLFPLEQTIVDVNVDMVGRVDEKYKNNPEYIYVIGSDRLSSQLHKINETMNQRYTQLTLDYTYNDEKDPNRYYYRSDHYNFAEKEIPSIFYFNGVHEDYHKTTDTIDKINFEKMESVARLIFHTTWELANRLERINVDVK